MKKAMKYLSMAAFVLVGVVMASCSSSDSGIEEKPQQPASKDNVVTLTTTVSLDGGSEARGTTRAVDADGTKYFKVGDQIDVIYVNTTDQSVKATSVALTEGDITNSGKSAKFTVTVTNPKTGYATSIRYFYPAGRLNGEDMLDFTWLDEQDGTIEGLSSNEDICYNNTASWYGESLPTLALVNVLTIGKFTIKYPNSDTDITSTITGMTVSDGTDTYTISRSAAAGPIWVAMRPISAGSTVTITATDGTNNYTKSVTIASGKDLEAGNIYPINVTMALVPSAPTDAINGKFSVSSTKQVYFSKGNLQAVIASGGPTNTYNYSASSWKFADHQWDIIGNNPGNTTFAAGTTVDLFGWVGTTASYDTYGLCTRSSSNNDYYGTSTSDNLKSDWGKNIGDGNTWRTLTNDEWGYIFSTRTDASQKYGHGSVGGVNGMIILPDMWTLPTGLSFTAGNSDWINSYTTEQWAQMEAAGAVFLPAAGYRENMTVWDAGSSGRYWSSSPYTSSADNAYLVKFGSNYLRPQDSDLRNIGYSVRLVKDVAAASDYPMASTATSSDYGKVVCDNGHLHPAKTAVPSGCTAVAVFGYIDGSSNRYAIALQDAQDATYNTITNNLANSETDCAVPGTWTVTAPSGANWKVTTKDIYSAIFQGLGSTQQAEGGYTYDSTSNAYITEGINGTAISDTFYWSTSFYSNPYAWTFYRVGWTGFDINTSHKVRPVLAF